MQSMDCRFATRANSGRPASAGQPATSFCMPAAGQQYSSCHGMHAIHNHHQAIQRTCTTDTSLQPSTM